MPRRRRFIDNNGVGLRKRQSKNAYRPRSREVSETSPHANDKMNKFRTGSCEPSSVSWIAWILPHALIDRSIEDQKNKVGYFDKVPCPSGPSASCVRTWPTRVMLHSAPS